MSKEHRNIEISLLVHDSDHLPPSPDGEHMYADDVVTELRDAMQAALDAWYTARGHQLLATEPFLI